MTKNAYNFAGDYFYQLSRRESVNTDLLKTKVKYVVQNAKKNRPSFVPRAVFVIRDGLSEGQYEMVY